MIQLPFEYIISLNQFVNQHDIKERMHFVASGVALGLADSHVECCLFEMELFGRELTVDERRKLKEKPVNEKEIDKILDVFESLGTLFHNNALAHGFWAEIDEISNIIKREEDKLLCSAGLVERFQTMVACEKLALMHSEISEWLEGVRKNPMKPDEHCPDFTTEEVEAADIIIRVLEAGKRNNLRIGSAIIAKHLYNVGRPHKHGKRN